jgi:hypothetical protein
MKNLILTLVTAGLFFSCNQSATNTANQTASNVSSTEAPQMKFEKPLHDFGKIHTGDKVSYDFKFTNNGKSPLIITDAVATCGCTKPTWPQTPIKPGESGMIHVTFDSASKIGLQDKMITITANTNPPQNMVHLIGEVLATNK